MQLNTLSCVLYDLSFEVDVIGLFNHGFTTPCRYANVYQIKQVTNACH